MGKNRISKLRFECGFSPLVSLGIQKIIPISNCGCHSTQILTVCRTVLYTKFESLSLSTFSFSLFFWKNEIWSTFFFFEVLTAWYEKVHVKLTGSVLKHSCQSRSQSQSQSLIEREDRDCFYIVCWEWWGREEENKTKVWVFVRMAISIL